MKPVQPADALLGCFLSGFAEVESIEEQVNDDDWPSMHHVAVWHGIRTVHHNGLEINGLTVWDQVKGDELLAGYRPEYLHTLMQACPGMPAMAPHYAELMVEEAMWRRLDDLRARLPQCRDHGMSADETKQFAVEALEALETHDSQPVATMLDSLGTVYDTAERGVTGALPTKWADLNAQIYGWFPGQLVVVGARPGVGKSLFAENSATFAAQQGTPVYFASLEMSGVELTQRTVAALGKVQLQRLRTGQATGSDLASMDRVFPVLRDLPMEHADRASQQVADIVRGVRKMRRRYGRPPLVVVDYLQLLDGFDPRVPRNVQVGRDTAALKRLARAEQTTVIALSQLNRDSEQGSRPSKPRLSNLKESGSIEQDADVVLLLHVPDEDDPSHLEVIIAKQRSGPADVSVELVKQGWYARLESVSRLSAVGS